MKLKFPLFFISAFLVWSCQKSEISPERYGTDELEVLFSISASPLSRAATDDHFTTVFENGDEIGIFAVQHAEGTDAELLAGGNYADNIRMRMTDGEWVMDEAIYFPDNGDELDFYAYYPYSADVDPTAIAYNASEKMYDLMVASIKDASATEGTNVELMFGHRLALVEVHIDGRGESLLMKNVITDATINIATGSTVLGNTPGDIKVGEYKDHKSYRLYVPEQTVAAGTEFLDITVGATQTSRFTTKAETELKAGTATKFTIRTGLGDIDAMPNCYMVKPGETVEIPVAKAYYAWLQEDYLGNLNLKTTGEPSAELLWMDTQGLVAQDGFTFTKDDDNVENSVIKVTAADGKTGNALVAVKVGDTYRWAWHIWVTDYDPDNGGQTYEHNIPLINNGGTFSYTFMDRNVGATTADPTDINSFGVYFQGCRSTPFPGPADMNSASPTMKILYSLDGTPVINFEVVSSADYATNVKRALENPTTFIKAKNSNETSWMSTSKNTGYAISNYFWSQGYNDIKRLFDPCPEGWKLPSRGGSGNVGTSADPYDCLIYEKLPTSQNITSHFYSIYMTTFDNNAPYGHYPPSGRMHFQTGKYDKIGQQCLMYIGDTDAQSNTKAFELGVSADYKTQRSGYGRASALTVRCVREK